MRNKAYCVGCGLWFDPSMQATTYSCIFGASNEMTLCTHCARIGEKLIKDTNYNPRLLKQYELSLKYNSKLLKQYEADLKNKER